MGDVTSLMSDRIDRGNMESVLEQLLEMVRGGEMVSMVVVGSAVGDRVIQAAINAETDTPALIGQLRIMTHALEERAVEDQGIHDDLR